MSVHVLILTYLVIPACRESFRVKFFAEQYSLAKKDSGQAGMTSLIALSLMHVVHLEVPDEER
jgi:hypothetical protein